MLLLRRRWVAILWALGALVVTVWLRVVPAHGAEPAGTVTIGSKLFTENRLLAEIMAQLIETQTSLEVKRRINLGGTKIIFGALRSGQVDLYPEYTGTGWATLLGREERVGDPLRAFLTVQREFDEQFDLQWLDPFGFENSYALAMRADTADRLGVHSISDLRDHAAQITAGVSHEFLSRADGYPGLSKAYDLELGDVHGMEHGLAYEAIASGRTDLVDTWTTDAKLQRYPIQVLTDDRAFFPPYDAAPLIRGQTLRDHPELGPVLRSLAFRIDDERMQRLNYAVEEEGRAIADVASAFLVEEKLLAASEAVPQERRATNLVASLWQNRELLRDRGTEHIILTVIAVLLATAVAVPVGIALSRRESLSGLVLGATGVIQTIPSLALLAFMIPIPGLGLGARSAITALFLYALLPIVRNTYTGIREVDEDLIEAARGLGLTDRQILTRVQLPLAMPTIMAGIRTSTVISIGVATLAAFVGAGGLGDPIITGLQLNDTTLVLTGAVPAAALALLADWLLGRLERRLTPRGL